MGIVEKQMANIVIRNVKQDYNPLYHAHMSCIASVQDDTRRHGEHVAFYTIPVFYMSGYFLACYGVLAMLVYMWLSYAPLVYYFGKYRVLPRLRTQAIQELDQKRRPTTCKPPR